MAGNIMILACIEENIHSVGCVNIISVEELVQCYL